MQKILKRLITLVYKPLLSKYLSSVRRYHYKGIRLLIPPEVFHPGFFFSTKILLRYIGRRRLQGVSLMELGAGNGLISIYSAREGARVTATDINPIAIDYLGINGEENGVKLTVLQSDLFDHIPFQAFDVIAINPPYFKKNPVTPIDHAWYCGENGEYFGRLFNGLEGYVHPGSEVLMILSDGCDMEMIRDHAGKHGWAMRRILTRRNLMEYLYLFAIEPMQNKKRADLLIV